MFVGMSLNPASTLKNEQPRLALHVPTSTSIGTLPSKVTLEQAPCEAVYKKTE